MRESVVLRLKEGSSQQYRIKLDNREFAYAKAEGSSVSST